MGKRERDKGKRVELLLRDKLREFGWAGAERGQQRHGGPDSPDVRYGPTGCHFECKGVESLRLTAAIRQAEADAGPGEAPIVVWKKSRAPWVAILPLDVLLALLCEHEARELLE